MRISREALTQIPVAGVQSQHHVKRALEVAAARRRQLARFQGQRLFANVQMENRHVKKYCELDGSEAILPDHISEAVNYRTLDRRLE